MPGQTIEVDRIGAVPVSYTDRGTGRAFAAAIPGGQFRLLPATGHVPQLESPAELLAAILNFTRAETTDG
ncbi:MAG: hypothetical protein WBH47_19835 [Streptosporangiaceae bacterium]